MARRKNALLIPPVEGVIEHDPNEFAEPERLTLGEGLHAITPEEYHADPCPEPGLSAGLAQTLLVSTPLHAWTKSVRLNPDYEHDDKTAFDLGEAGHGALTSKGRGIRVIEAEDYKTKRAQEDRDQARAEGFTPLTRPQAKKLRRMLEAYRAQMRAHGIGDVFEAMPAEHKEAAIIWRAGGVWNRCLVDGLDLDNRIAYDFKTTGGLAEPVSWLRRTADLGQDLRARHYLDGLEQVLGGRWRYRFIVQEIEPPHCLCVVELSEGALWLGTKMIERAREIWGECVRGNRWPGFSSEIVRADLPHWREQQWLAREVAEQDYKQRTGRDVLAAAMQWQAPERLKQ